jgi:hypothetical protein
MEKPQNGKAYDLTFHQHQDYLYALVEGPRDSFNISISYWDEIAARVREGGYKKVLVEERLGTNVSKLEAFRIAARTSRMDFNGARIAFVDKVSDHKCVNEFAMGVSQSRGRVVRCFDTLHEAVVALC